MTRIEDTSVRIAHRYPLILAYLTAVSTVHLILDLAGVFS